MFIYPSFIWPWFWLLNGCCPPIGIPPCPYPWPCLLWDLLKNKFIRHYSISFKQKKAIAQMTHWPTNLIVFYCSIFYLLDKVDELGNIVSLFLISCLFQIILGLPEIDLKRLLVVAEASWLIEELDAFLCTFDILVKNVSDLIACEFLTVVVDFVVLELDGEDVSCLAEFLLNFLLSDTLWDEFDIDVRFEHFLLVLDNWVQRAVFWL